MMPSWNKADLSVRMQLIVCKMIIMFPNNKMYLDTTIFG